MTINQNRSSCSRPISPSFMDGCFAPVRENTVAVAIMHCRYSNKENKIWDLFFSILFHFFVCFRHTCQTLHPPKNAPTMCPFILRILSLKEIDMTLNLMNSNEINKCGQK